MANSAPPNAPTCLAQQDTKPVKISSAQSYGISMNTKTTPAKRLSSLTESQLWSLLSNLSMPRNMVYGHLDRLVRYGGDYYVQDQKTTGSSIGPWYFKRYNPDNQMSLYTAAGAVVFNTPVKGVMVDAAQVAMGFTRFERGFSPSVPTIKSRNGSRMLNTTSS
jgi:ATP-dependent exoDNAse (exonuclease V) beta subunit